MAKIKQATKKTGRQRKELIVGELVQKLDNSAGLVFTDYKGLTHRQLEDLKKELKTLDSSIVIAKNTLLRLAIDKSKFKENAKDLEAVFADPTATLFISADLVEPLKKLSKAIKDFGLPHIKVGILEGNVTDEAGVLKIASLPNRETLVAQFVGMLNSPISGLVQTLNGTIQKFVMTLDAVAKSKPETPAPAAEPAKGETPATETPSETTAETATEEATPAETPAEVPAAPIETDSPASTSSADSGERDENIESAEPET